MIIKLENTTTHQTYEYEVVDANNGEKLYFRFDINTADLDEGEYKLDLYDGDEHIATDLLKIGDFNTNTLQYKKGDNTYIAVTLDPNVQDKKQVEIDSINVTVSPDVSYTSMAQVAIDAQPLYDSAYNEGYVDGEAVSYENGYDDGLKDGEDIGYNKGFESGIEEQKSQLIPITITENGTYNREDGYNEVVVNVPDINGSYDEGFADGVEEGVSNAGEIIAETAQVLNITENGTYTSQYSQFNDYSKPEQVTGVFNDGKEFYNEAYLKGIICKTNDFIITPQTKVELWFKPVNYGWLTKYFLLDVENPSDSFELGVCGLSSTKNSFQAKIGLCNVNIDLTESEYKKMHHIVMSFVDGFWLDGVKIGDFEGDFSIHNSSYMFKINPDAVSVGGSSNYGMFKIDDVIIIPTEDGFLNVNTNELLKYTNVSTEPQYTYYNNFTEPVAEGNLIRTVNVNVSPKVNIQSTGIKLGHSTFSEVPDWADWDGITDMNNMFYYCTKLTALPQMDTSKVTDMYNMFYQCGQLKEIPQIDTSNVTNMQGMFYYCSSLETLPQIDTSKVTNMRDAFRKCTKLTALPQMDTSKVTDMYQAFEDCSSITTFPQIDTSKVTNMGYMIGNCTNLVSVPPLNAEKNTSNQIFYNSDMPKLTDFGGLIGLNCNFNGSYAFNKCPNLTYESCINILNGLADVTAIGIRTLKVHRNFLTTVGDEISIGTNKGWTITA